LSGFFENRVGSGVGVGGGWRRGEAGVGDGVVGSEAGGGEGCLRRIVVRRDLKVVKGKCVRMRGGLFGAILTDVRGNLGRGEGEPWNCQESIIEYNG
jgi:hypothetical protein